MMFRTSPRRGYGLFFFRRVNIPSLGIVGRLLVNYTFHWGIQYWIPEFLSFCALEMDDLQLVLVHLHVSSLKKIPWPWRWLSNQICQALPLIGGSSNWPSMKLTACSLHLKIDGWRILSYPFLLGKNHAFFWFIHESHAIPDFFLNNAEMLSRMNGDLQRAKVIAHRLLGGKNGRWEKTGCWERELFESTGQDRYVSMTCIFIYNWYNIYIYKRTDIIICT